MWNRGVVRRSILAGVWSILELSARSLTRCEPVAGSEYPTLPPELREDLAMKSHFVFSLLLLLPLAGLQAAEKSPDESRPNIMVFLVDDMGVMDTSVPFLTDASGKPKRYPLNDYYRTPNMKRLARRGIRLNNFYAMSVCSPTRCSILTGQNAARHRTTNWINPDRNNGGPYGPPQWNWQGLKRDSVTLPRLLRTAGYRTIHVGKGHFGPTAFEGAEPKNLGFDVNVAGWSIGAPGSYYGEKDYARPNRAVPHLEKYHGTDTFLTEALTIEAKSHVTDAVKADKPFFLYFAHYAVHAPFDSDPRFAANYVDSGKPAPAQAFATLIEGMDKSLGDMLDHLDELGVADNTLIFFLGDNGSDAPLGHQHAVACAAPLRGKKGAHYEGGMRVPFIAAWAEADDDNAYQKELPIVAGAVQSQPAAVMDLFPTILELVDVEPPEDHVVDGSRLDTLLTGKPDKSRDETFLMHYPHSPHRSNYFTVWRDGDWKVIYHYYPSEASEGSHYQLYNLADDPFEQNNLAEKKPDVLRRMMRGLIAAMEKHKALYPVDKQDGATPLKPQLP
jgi:arylsulfatase A-like enzyme